MILRVLAALVTIALVVDSPAAAQHLQPLSYERVRNRSDMQLDPTRAYVLIETTFFGDIELVKQATPQERSLWDQDRREALAQAQEDWPVELAEHQRRAARGRSVGEPPAEPTEANFIWPQAESRLRVQISANHRFSSDDGVVLYLYEVPPGTYYFYAYHTIMTRDCLCMGSVSFPVEAGAITALRVERHFLGTQGEVLTERPRGVSAMERWTRSGISISAPTPAAFHPRLPRGMVRPALLTAVPELPNWGGFIVNRLLPIEGLFHYDRDRMVIERRFAE